MRRYDSAYKYADLCLSLNGKLVDYNSIIVSTSASASFTRFNDETIFYTSSSNGYTFTCVSPTYARVDSNLYNMYAADDLRKNLFFYTSGVGKRFRGTYDNTGTNLFTGLATDEIYLIRAECAARQGSIQPALADLNTLLKKRWQSVSFIPFNSSSQADILNKILEERRKELVFRGLRWPDIKRLNREGYKISITRNLNGVTQTLLPDDHRFVFPLPQDIINITGMPQNPQ